MRHRSVAQTFPFFVLDVPKSSFLDVLAVPVKSGVRPFCQMWHQMRMEPLDMVAVPKSGTLTHIPAPGWAVRSVH